MFQYILLMVFTVMPLQYHSLGLDFSSLVGSGNNTVRKGFQELCQIFCDEGDYSDDLFGDFLDETQPRVLCWICHKKRPSSTTKAPTTTTEPSTTTTTLPTTTTTMPTSTPSNSSSSNSSLLLF